jgi:hypothetical protein
MGSLTVNFEILVKEKHWFRFDHYTTKLVDGQPKEYFPDLKLKCF